MFAAPLLLAALLAPLEPAAPPGDGAFAASPAADRVTLTGTVRDESGEPLAGATVTAIPTADPENLVALPPVTTDAAGRFAVPAADPEAEHYLIAAVGDGADRRVGRVWVQSASDRAGRPVEITAGPVVDVTVDIAFHDGRPAAGAAVENWRRPAAARFDGMTAEIAGAAGLPWDAAADGAGAVTLRDLPPGGTVAATVDAPGAHEQTVTFTVAGGDAGTVALAESARVTAVFTAPAGAAAPADGYRLRGSTARTESRLDGPVDAVVTGDRVVVTAVVAPGQFGGLLTHPDLIFTPSFFVTAAEAGGTAEVELEASAPAFFTGRFVDPAGEPLGDADPTAGDMSGWRMPDLGVLTYSAIGYFAGTDLGYGAGWQPVNFPVNREAVGPDGRFRVRAPRAKVKLIASDLPGKTFPTVIEANAAGGGRDLGDVTLHPLPEVTGAVRDAGGRPVPGAIVVPDGGQFDTRFDPVLADAAGRFAFTPDAVPPAGEGGVHPLKIKAFAPLAARVGAAEVPLRKGEAPAAVTVTLAPGEPPAAPEPKVPTVTSAGGPFPLSVGDPAPAVSAAAGYAATGGPADPISLADLRGRWVLLDVRSTWCGNCRAEEPVLDAVAAGFGEQLTVVSVYDVSDAPEKVAAYLADHPAPGPAARDADDGATVKAYGVRGFPTRVLIDPAGRVRTYGGLRSPELPSTLRAFLLGGDPDGAADEDADLKSEGAAPAVGPGEPDAAPAR